MSGPPKAQLVGCCYVLRVGHAERGQAPNRLSWNAEWLSAGGEELQVRASLKQGVCQCGGGRDEMLAVVENQQKAPRADGIGEAFNQRTSRALADVQHCSYSRRDEVWICDGVQSHQPHAMRIVR